MKPIFFESFLESVFSNAQHALATDTLKIMICNVRPDKSQSSPDSLTEIATAGYTTGGYAVTVRTASGQDDNYIFSLDDLTITASGGVIGPGRYFVLYNDTGTLNQLICFFDYGKTLTLADTTSLIVDFSESLFEISIGV